MGNTSVLAVARQQFAHRHVVRKVETIAAQTCDEAGSREALGKGDAARGQEAAREAERLGQPQPPEIELGGVADLERHAQQRVLRHAYRAHHPVELGIGADQDVLAVVEFRALTHHAARATAGHRARLEHRDAHTASGERDRRGHAGIAGSHDCYAATQVRHAIQNLRSGVSEVRRVRTWKPSRCISSRSVR